jgi:hypothetical protein
MDYSNPTLPGNFFLDADSDSDIDPGAEDWTNGYFESRNVDKLPVCNNFHEWLSQMTHLYQWHLLKAEPKNGYYFALFDVGMDDSELAFCFRHSSGRDKKLSIEVFNEKGQNIRLKQWGSNASIIQEYQVWNKNTGEAIKVRELNGYVIRLKRFPTHLRVLAKEFNGSHKVVFDEQITNIIDSVRGIENITANKLPDTSTLDKWLKVVGLRSWKLLNKASNDCGFFAVFKIDDNTFAFCRQLSDDGCIYDCETTLQLTDLKGKPLQLDFAVVRTLNRRYRIVKMVDKSSQITKYSIIDGSKFRAKEKLPDKFRVKFIMRGDNRKPVVCFDELVNFN